ncbi:MBL fold metallo-hydrolase [Wenjunlia vitaminophila]|uniref:MBL fold metallo-hydrolase n=1 Tax=Wenjunlia vitaminophila TaxID=76728 RepID=A0A0T6LYM8_WENVI|nr:MBL fold metallo-hydrolase [Wenjunlia vitaminophila]KRV51283.1 MBL fold metallo-hydrolase [Wenjunlia vitaminophila]
MKLTKQGHACVRVERHGRALVIDPGGFTEPDAAVGADALLVTHEHPDHFDEGRLRAALEANPAAEVWTLRSVADRISTAFPGRVHTVGDGDTFTAAGFEVEVHGELHAVIHPDIPRITNVGYVVEGRLFHPGDAFTVPGRPVESLMLPIHAPWSKIQEVLDYVREVAPARTFSLHDGLLSENGFTVYDRLLGAGGPVPDVVHRRLLPGESTELG